MKKVYKVTLDPKHIGTTIEVTTKRWFRKPIVEVFKCVADPMYIHFEFKNMTTCQKVSHEQQMELIREASRVGFSSQEALLNTFKIS